MVLGLSQYNLNGVNGGTPGAPVSRCLPAPFRGEGLGIPTAGFLFTSRWIAAVPDLKSGGYASHRYIPPALALGRMWARSGPQAAPAQRRPTLHHGPSNTGPTHSQCRAPPAGDGWYACARTLRVCGPRAPEKGIHRPPRGVQSWKLHTPLLAR